MARMRTHRRGANPCEGAKETSSFMPASLCRGAALSLIALFLVACSDSGMDDLHQFVQQAKLKKGKVEPLPEFKPVETFGYTAHKLKDPFATWKSEVKTASQEKAAGQGIRPDVDRRKEILENFPLDTLRMLGTLQYEGTEWGLVKAPDGIVYKVREGNHVGQNYGQIRDVNEQKLVLTEIVPNGLGGWEERETSLSISEE